MRRLVLAVLALSACGQPATLTTVQAEVFNPSCNFAACHKAAGSNGLNLEGPAYQKLVNVKAQGPGVQSLILVVPGKPEDSYLYQKLAQPSPAAGVQMPQTGDVLSADRLQLVREWIAAGAKND